MKTDKIKLLIAEDHKIMRRALAEELNCGSIEVLGAAENGQILIELISKEVPDIVLLDLEMPVMTGKEALEHIAVHYPGVRCVIYSYDNAPLSISGMVMKGACAYLTKDVGIDDIKKAIENVYYDGYYFNAHLSRQILDELRDSKKPFVYIGESKYTEIEIEVIKLLWASVPTEKMAEMLGMTTFGIQAHKKRIYKKAEANNVVSLVKYAIKHGIIVPTKGGE